MAVQLIRKVRNRQPTQLIGVAKTPLTRSLLFAASAFMQDSVSGKPPTISGAYRISADSGGITVRLRQGTTTIATWTHATAPTSLTTYAQTLTSGEADSITNYAALKLQFEATP